MPTFEFTPKRVAGPPHQTSGPVPAHTFFSRLKNSNPALIKTFLASTLTLILTCSHTNFAQAQDVEETTLSPQASVSPEIKLDAQTENLTSGMEEYMRQSESFPLDEVGMEKLAPNTQIQPYADDFDFGILGDAELLRDEQNENLSKIEQLKKKVTSPELIEDLMPLYRRSQRLQGDFWDIVNNRDLQLEHNLTDEQMLEFAYKQVDEDQFKVTDHFGVAKINTLRLPNSTKDTDRIFFTQIIHGKYQNTSINFMPAEVNPDQWKSVKKFIINQHIFGRDGKGRHAVLVGIDKAGKVAWTKSYMKPSMFSLSYWKTWRAGVFKKISGKDVIQGIGIGAIHGILFGATGFIFRGGHIDESLLYQMGFMTSFSSVIGAGFKTYRNIFSTGSLSWQTFKKAWTGFAFGFGILALDQHGVEVISTWDMGLIVEHLKTVVATRAHRVAPDTIFSFPSAIWAQRSKLRDINQKSIGYRTFRIPIPFREKPIEFQVERYFINSQRDYLYNVLINAANLLFPGNYAVTPAIVAKFASVIPRYYTDVKIAEKERWREATAMRETWERWTAPIKTVGEWAAEAAKLPFAGSEAAAWAAGAPIQEPSLDNPCANALSPVRPPSKLTDFEGHGSE